jgi:hypothetical protein
MRTVTALAFLAMFLILPGRAQAVTPEEQAACQPDAFRLCGQAIPDERRVKACLLHNVRRLSPPCRRVFSRGSPGRRASRGRRR